MRFSHRQATARWGNLHFGSTMKSTSTYSRGYLIALIATVLWSTTGPFISYLSKTYALPSLVLAFWRDLFV